MRTSHESGFSKSCRPGTSRYLMLCLILLLAMHIYFRSMAVTNRINVAFGLPQLIQNHWSFASSNSSSTDPLLNPKLPNTTAERTKRTDFLHNWFRLHKARIDWYGILQPCKGNTEWGSARPGWGKENRTSGEKSYIDFMDIRPATEFSRIFIQTRTKSGRTKTVGGDSWRVYFRGPSSVAATVFDHANGTYEAMALLVEPGIYTVEAVLDYSLCDGLKDPPRNWFKTGNAQGKYQRSGIIGFLDEYLLEPLQGRRTFTVSILSHKTFSGIDDIWNISCHETCNSLWHGYGRWIADTWWPYVTDSKTEAPRITPTKRKGTLWIYGDSLAQRFQNSLSRKSLCLEIFSSCQHSYNWVYPVPGGIEAESKRRNDDFDFRPNLVLESIWDVLRRDDMKGNDSLLVLNLGLHFPIGINFATYQQLIRDVIKMLKYRKQELGSTACVIWKTMTAIHKEKVEWPRNKTHWRFFTDQVQRVRLFDAFAMSAMCKAGIKILDVYHLTASYPYGTSDIVHYSNQVFHKAEMEIQRYATTDDKPRQVCTG